MSLRWRKKISFNQLQLLIFLLAFGAIGIMVQSIYAEIPRVASEGIKGLFEIFGVTSCMTFLAAGFLAMFLSACAEISRGFKR